MGFSDLNVRKRLMCALERIKLAATPDEAKKAPGKGQLQVPRQTMAAIQNRMPTAQARRGGLDGERTGTSSPHQTAMIRNAVGSKHGPHAYTYVFVPALLPERGARLSCHGVGAYMGQHDARKEAQRITGRRNQRLPLCPFAAMRRMAKGQLWCTAAQADQAASRCCVRGMLAPPWRHPSHIFACCHGHAQLAGSSCSW